MGILDFLFYDAFRSASEEKAKKRELEEKRQQQLADECADSFAAIGEKLVEYTRRTNPDYLADEFKTGTFELPLYCAMRVLQVQERSATTQQRQSIAALFNNEYLDFSEPQFYGAAHNKDSSLARTLEEKVGISETHAGSFWRYLFRIMGTLDCSESDLQFFIDKVSSLVRCFCEMGAVPSNTAPALQDELSDAISKQIVACREAEPVQEWLLDYFDDSGTPNDYKAQLENLVLQLVNNSVDKRMKILYLSMDSLFQELMLGLVQRSWGSWEAKGAVLDYLMDYFQNWLSLMMDGAETLEVLENGTDELLAKTVTGNYEFILGCVAGMAEEQNNTGALIYFYNGCSNFLKSTEKMLADRFPHMGFDNIAREYFEELNQAALYDR